MSATGRNILDRDPFDYYPTPAWCVDRLVEAAPHLRTASTVLEPCAGDGAIVRALRPYTDAKIAAWEIQARFRVQLEQCADDVSIGDAFELSEICGEYVRIEGAARFDLTLTNPSFSLAYFLLRSLWSISDRIVFLLRLSFLASIDRYPFLSERAPDLYVLPNRPIFHQGSSDNCDYAWFEWDTQHPKSVGSVQLLKLTTKAERIGQSARTPHEEVIRFHGGKK